MPSSTPVPAFADYPAAHSMDTEWFCVDAHGRVARFDTSEDGALPNAAAVGLSPGDASFDVEQARALAERAGVRWIASTADLFELLEDSEGDDGLFHFQCEDGEKPGLHTRAAVPTHALTLDDLPAAIRGEVGNLVLPVDFAADTTVQLSAHLADSEVSTWSELPLDNLADQEVEPLLPPGQTTSSLLIMTVVVLVLVALLFWVIQ